jgi:transcriptional regulator with XRE-family HTH domain
MKVGENIRTIRGLKDISQEYLAQKIGVSQSCLQKIESNLSSPTIEKLNDIAKTLEVSLEQLLNFDKRLILKTEFKDNSASHSNIFTNKTDNFDNERKLFERMVAKRDQEILELKEEIKLLKERIGGGN